MPQLDRDELADLLGYALLKVPPALRLALAAPDPDRQRAAETRIAERILGDMRQLEVSGPPGSYVRRSCAGHPALPLPVTEADLPY